MRRNGISIAGFVLLALFLDCALPALAQTPNVRSIDLNNRVVELADGRNYLEAIELFRQAIELGPDYPLFHAHLGTSLYQAIRLNSHVAKVQFFLGQLHLLNRDRQSALAQYKKLALLDTELSNKLYGAIYANQIFQVGQK